MRDTVFEKFGTPLKIDGYERKYAAREVSINPQEVERQLHGDSRFDLVEYDREKRLFNVIELKLGHHRNVIRQAFEQVAKYHQALEGNAQAFLDAFTRKCPMRFTRLMESSYGGKGISVEFYVGLTDEACKDYEFLHILRDRYPDTGIIRVKQDGRIKNYIKKPDGTRDYEIAQPPTFYFSVVGSSFNAVAHAPAAPSENELCATSC